MGYGANFSDFFKGIFASLKQKVLSLLFYLSWRARSREALQGLEIYFKFLVIKTHCLERNVRSPLGTSNIIEQCEDRKRL